jgi:hypothetical protein
MHCTGFGDINLICLHKHTCNHVEVNTQCQICGPLSLGQVNKNFKN